MRYTTLLQLTALLAATALAGCSSNGSTTSSAALDTRIQQATRHSSLSQRNAELQRIALDAADSGHVQQAVRATQDITLVPLRNDTARAAARSLKDQGQMEAATKLASLITDPTMRNQLMIELSSTVKH
jgi:hypothetical protein